MNAPRESVFWNSFHPGAIGLRRCVIALILIALCVGGIYLLRDYQGNLAVYLMILGVIAALYLFIAMITEWTYIILYIRELGRARHIFAGGCILLSLALTAAIVLMVPEAGDYRGRRNPYIPLFMGGVMAFSLFMTGMRLTMAPSDREIQAVQRMAVVVERNRQRRLKRDQRRQGHFPGFTVVLALALLGAVYWLVKEDLIVAAQRETCNEWLNIANTSQEALEDRQLSVFIESSKRFARYQSEHDLDTDLCSSVRFHLSGIERDIDRRLDTLGDQIGKALDQGELLQEDFDAAVAIWQQSERR